MLRRRTLLRAGVATVATLSVTGCQDGGSQELAVQHVRLVTDRPAAYREYEKVAEATYDRGDVVWLYFEPVGVATEPTGGGERIQLSTSLTTTGPDGSDTVLEDAVDRSVGDGESRDTLYLYWRFDPDDPVLPGEYDAEITVTDELADGETASATEAFVLGAADVGNPYVEAFRMDVDANLDVEIEAAGVSERTVRFEYRSDHGIDTRASGEEVGYVVGRYTAYVANGLETDGLVATVDAADGDYRYRFSSETARAWANGDLTTDDVVSGIYEAIEQR